jgi:DNA-binding CsgD family transcriptional regulator/tetratricopeptide (TPR) repeat protein
LVEGEAGIGKSRLIREFLTTTSLHVLVAACPPYREPFTLAPIVDVLQQSLNTVAGLRLTGLAGALRPLFPEWADDLPPAPEPLDDARAARHRLFRALADLIDIAKADALVIEDVQWADDATLEFVLFMAARQPAQPISLVATYRPEDIVDGSLVRRLSERFPAGITHIRMTLQPLDQASTTDMISSMIDGEPVTDAFAAFMQAHTDGVPLAIEESMRLLGDRAHLTRHDGAWVRRALTELQVPPTVRDATLERTRRLPQAVRRVLDAVAVLGAADETVVANVAGIAPEEVQAGLADAHVRGLLTETNSGKAMFRHSLIGRAVYEAIPAIERRSLHLAAGLAIERADPRQFDELTRHFRGAGDIERWAVYAQKAADRATASGDHTTAVEILYELLSTANLPASARAHIARAIAIAALARRSAVDDLHHRVVSILHNVLDSPDLTPAQQAEIRNPLGRLLITQGEADAGLAHLEQAVRYLTSSPLEAARSMTYLGWAFAGPWPASTHRNWLQRAAAAAAEVESPLDRLSLAGDRAAALLMLGDETAIDVMSTLPLEASTAAENRTVARINSNTGKVALLWGRYSEARERLSSALTIADAEQLARLRFSIVLGQADLDWFTGRWDGLADRAAELADADRDRPVTYLAAVRLAARLDAANGRIRASDQKYRLVLDEATRLGALDDTMEAAAMLARRLLTDGRVDDALHLTERPMQIVHNKRVWIWATELAPARVETLLAAGRGADAAALVNRFARGLRRRNAPAPRAALAVCRALLSAGGDDHVKTAAAFGRAAQAWESLPRPYDALLARERQGHFLLDSGEEDAVRRLSEVLAGFSSLGATADASRVTRWLDEHADGEHKLPGQRWRGGRRGYGEQLSPREIEVVTLVVAGKTNGQIARRLAKSPRTVEGQIRSAMRKLGVTSRTTLAVAAIKAGTLPVSKD